jgi:predicted nuclease with TOPRIM domain
MNEAVTEDGKTAFEQAAGRLDEALARLDKSVVNARGRLAALDSAEADVRRLSSERTRLAAELDRAQTKARRLDDKASEVSRRLVDAMEGVKTVLSGGAG